jgi:hypothetical protein
MKKKTSAAYSAFMLVGGPKNMPLMLEQSGVRYATLFTSEKAVSRFQLECCSLNSYDPIALASPTEALAELQKAQKFGCGLLLVDPPGPEIDKQKTQTLAAFIHQLSVEPPK